MEKETEKEEVFADSLIDANIKAMHEIERRRSMSTLRERVENSVFVCPYMTITETETAGNNCPQLEVWREWKRTAEKKIKMQTHKDCFYVVPKRIVERIDRETAKNDIVEYIENENITKRISIYPSKIAEHLHIDYDLCVDIVIELMKEGKIEIDMENEG